MHEKKTIILINLLNHQIMKNYHSNLCYYVVAFRFVNFDVSFVNKQKVRSFFIS